VPYLRETKETATKVQRTMTTLMVETFARVLYFVFLLSILRGARGMNDFFPISGIFFVLSYVGVFVYVTNYDSRTGVIGVLLFSRGIDIAFCWMVFWLVPLTHPDLPVLIIFAMIGSLSVIICNAILIVYFYFLSVSGADGR
jgi:hypothetical protein